MRRLIATLLLSSCAASTLRPPDWPDTDVVLDSIHCAIAQVHGESVADEVLRTRVVMAPELPMVSRYDPWSNTVALRTGDRALTSGLRHELLEHRLPHVLEDNPQLYGHDPRITEAAKRLDVLASECRRAAR